MKYKYFFTIFFSLFLSSLFSQNNTEFIYDNFEEGGEVLSSIQIGDRFFLAGNSIDTLNNRPSVTCVDTNGNVIWNTAFQNGLPYYNQKVNKIIYGNDGFIYGYTSNNVLFKVNILTGQVTLTTTIYSTIYDIDDYNGDLIILSNNNSYEIQKINKSTFQNSSLVQLNTSNVKELIVDSNLDIYQYGLDSIIKRNHLNLSQTIWKVKYNSYLFGGQINKIQIDEANNRILAEGNRFATNFSVLININPLSGTVFNSLQIDLNLNTSFKASKMIFSNQNVYISFIQSTTSLSPTPIKLIKYSFSSNTVLWQTSSYLNPTLRHGIIDFVLDSLQNSYVLSFQSNDGLYQSGIGNLKIDSLGNILNSHIISKNSTPDLNSFANRIFLHNNDLFISAKIQCRNYGDEGNGLKFIKLNSNTGDTIWMKSYAGFRIRSTVDTRLIADIPSGGYFIVSRKGNLMNVRKYNDFSSLIFDKNYELSPNQYSLKPICAKVNSLGRLIICVESYSLNFPTNINVTNNLSDISFFTIDSLGTFISNQSVQSYGVSLNYNARILDFYVDDIQALLLVWNGSPGSSAVRIVRMLNNGNISLINQVFGYNPTKYSFYNQDANNIGLLESTSNTIQKRTFSKQNVIVTSSSLLSNSLGSVTIVKEFDSLVICSSSNNITSNKYLSIFNKYTDVLVWEKVYSNTEVISFNDMVIDTISNVLFLSYSSGAFQPYLTKIKKYDLLTGLEIATFTKNSAPFGYQGSLSIVLDKFSNRIVCGGDRDDLSTVQNYYYVLDTNLSFKYESIIGTGNYIQMPLVNGLKFNGNHELVIFGNLPHNSLNKGFINHATITHYDTLNITSSCYFHWQVNDSIYNLSTNDNYFSISSSGNDTLFTLDLTIIPSLPLIITNTFSLPSDATTCVGELAVSISGNADFELNVDNGTQIVNTSGYSLINNLCPGVHDLLVTDNCGDSLTTQIVIPIDSNYVFNNPFIDSIAVDSLGTTIANCDIYYNSIDTAYIDSIWASGNTVNVIWNIVDANGSNLDTTSYVLNNGNGVYWLQLSVFCPTKALGDYFTVTEAIYFNNGMISMADLAENTFQFDLYPNPTNNEVTLTFDSNEAQVYIYDTQGKLIQTKSIHSGEQVSLKEVETGVYFFEVTTEKGSAVKRVVKN